MKEAPAPEIPVLTRSPEAAVAEASAEDAAPGAGLSDEQAVANRAVDTASRVKRTRRAFMGNYECPVRRGRDATMKRCLRYRGMTVRLMRWRAVHGPWIGRRASPERFDR